MTHFLYCIHVHNVLKIDTYRYKQPKNNNKITKDVILECFGKFSCNLDWMPKTVKIPDGLIKNCTLNPGNYPRNILILFGIMLRNVLEAFL